MSQIRQKSPKSDLNFQILHFFLSFVTNMKLQFIILTFCHNFEEHLYFSIVKCVTPTFVIWENEEYRIKYKSRPTGILRKATVIKASGDRIIICFLGFVSVKIILGESNDFFERPLKDLERQKTLLCTFFF